jgi:hypothetical protein
MFPHGARESINLLIINEKRRLKESQLLKNENQQLFVRFKDICEEHKKDMGPCRFLVMNLLDARKAGWSEEKLRKKGKAEIASFSLS